MGHTLHRLPAVLGKESAVRSAANAEEDDRPGGWRAGGRSPGLSQGHKGSQTKGLVSPLTTELPEAGTSACLAYRTSTPAGKSLLSAGTGRWQRFLVAWGF